MSRVASGFGVRMSTGARSAGIGEFGVWLRPRNTVAAHASTESVGYTGGNVSLGPRPALWHASRSATSVPIGSNGLGPGLDGFSMRDRSAIRPDPSGPREANDSRAAYHGRERGGWCR